MLAANVHLVVIVRRDRKREGPNKSILHLGGRVTDSGLRPDFDRGRHIRSHIPSRDDSTNAAEAGRARADKVRVNGIRRRPAAFTAGDGTPCATRNTAVAREKLAVRWTAS